MPHILDFLSFKVLLSQEKNCALPYIHVEHYIGTNVIIYILHVCLSLLHFCVIEDK